ncbi:hypothetical protein ACFQV2_26455 [Actinokineospora soli]|uniref:Uncharacterized protein n=1 Tax=Actinokineospora soli TaxID=1048753 RepID=A0ABW2TT19_9PSEU
MTVHFVLPADVDDPASASGGNTYDRQVAGLLDVRELPVAGAWPRPSDTARAALAAALDALPDGASVLIDGLVACGVPEVVVPARRGCGSRSWCTCRWRTRWAWTRPRRRRWTRASARC